MFSSTMMNIQNKYNMIETIYSDFTTKLLPQIQEGLSLTKDYFMDLFGRYIQYLLISDIITAVGFLVVGCISLYAANRFWQSYKSQKDHYSSSTPEIPATVLLIFSVFMFLGVFSKTMDIVKDIYVPEIRVYEKLSDYKSHSDRN